MPDPILLTAYTSLRGHFDDTHAYLAARNALQAPHNHFQFGDLEDLVPYGGEHALVIYFGLVGNDLRYGIRIVELQATDNDSVFVLAPDLINDPGSDPSHIVDEGNLVPVDSFPLTWAEMHSAYFANVVVDRVSDGRFAALNPTHDPKAIVLPWTTKVLALWRDNEEEISELPARVMISSLARNHTEGVGYNGPAGYRHSAGLHIQVYVSGTWRDLLDDSNPTPLTYRNHGADFGNCCPPMCAEFSAANP